jgi:hypothetical protein
MSDETSIYVLDADDRITQVSGPIRERLGPYVGHSLWEASPHAREVFEPYFAEARATGREVEFTALYSGRVERRRVVPSGRALTVHVTPVAGVDVRTLATLTGSLRAIEDGLADRASERPGRRAPGSLRALP